MCPRLMQVVVKTVSFAVFNLDSNLPMEAGLQYGLHREMAFLPGLAQPPQG